MRSKKLTDYKRFPTALMAKCAVKFVYVKVLILNFRKQNLKGLLREKTKQRRCNRRVNENRVN